MPYELQRTRIRAPRKHGEAVIVPPFAAVPRLLADQREALGGAGYDVQGLPLARLSEQARRALLEEARRYSTAYRDVVLPADAGRWPLVLAGHQPQLFHPGVWFKDFALAALGRGLGAVAVNLLVDNDIVQSVALRVPGGDSALPRIESIALDQPAEAIPYEERAVIDGRLFASFGRRVAEHGGRHLPAPLIGRLWPLAQEAARRSANLGRCLAEARHRLEEQWGLQTLEVPLSVVCRGAAFLRFACHVLAHLPRFRDLHNACLAEYRRVHRVRSRSHPVPDLAADGSWREAPFWVWTDRSPTRRHLFVRDTGGGLELSDRAGTELRLALSPTSDAGPAVEQLTAWSDAGVRLRPRALITTMFARLVLGDLFMHGIGGAKYDQLTDLIVERFFGFRPPAFLTLSATALLFEDRTPQLQQQLREARQLLRELRFHPERHVAAATELAALIAEKQQWVQRQPPRGQRLVRHRALERINAALQPAVEENRRQLATVERDVAETLRGAALAASREFSFCLFSEEKLPALLLDLSRSAATLV